MTSNLPRTAIAASARAPSAHAERGLERGEHAPADPDGLTISERGEVLAVFGADGAHAGYVDQLAAVDAHEAEGQHSRRGARAVSGSWVRRSAPPAWNSVYVVTRP